MATSPSSSFLLLHLQFWNLKQVKRQRRQVWRKPCVSNDNNNEFNGIEALHRCARGRSCGGSRCLVGLIFGRNRAGGMFCLWQNSTRVLVKWRARESFAGNLLLIGRKMMKSSYILIAHPFSFFDYYATLNYCRGIKVCLFTCLFTCFAF